MEVKSVSGNRFYVQDLQISITFYEKLGFRPGKRDEESAIFNLNWYFIELKITDVKERFENHASGSAMCLRVDGIQSAYEYLLQEGFKPNNPPTKMPNGNTEFTLTDPDGYAIVFFDK
jgi:catechol 2,3-dioxygenase-like lactoylglutathione lyase family enzyme